MTDRHILMSVDTVGGIWTYALDLGAELRRRGRRVTLAVFGPAPSEAQRAEAERHDLILVETGHPPGGLAPEPAAIRAGGRALARLAARRKADLVHLNHPELAVGANVGPPVLALCHSCVATWWDAVRGGPMPEDLRWRARLHESGIAEADAVAAPSASFAEATRRVYGFGIAPLAVPNGRARPKDAVLSAEMSPSVLTAGRLWDEGKNLAVLDRAAARLPVTVEAAGPCEGPTGTVAVLRHVTPLGPLPQADLMRRLAERPVYVSSSLYEPFGLAVLEAAQAGCPLVLSDIPTFRELWDGCAAFVQPHDDRGLAAAIVRLLGDRTHRDARGRAAAARAALFTIERCADLTERAHAAAIAAHAVRSRTGERAAS